MSTLLNPGKEFTLLPFWFWNDVLREEELLRQIDSFQAHGVHGFVIHPRVGLPRDTAFMSDHLLHFVNFAVDEAARRGMQVILYDEGMYPSGSASGLVVKADRRHHCRCYSHQTLEPGEEPQLEAGQNLAALVERPNGRRMAVIDREVNTSIRGLHYIGEGPAEDEPPAGDILNPAAIKSFINIVYDGFHRAVGKHFGKTVIGIFTDEPNPLGRCRERGVVPGTTGFLAEASRLLGYDFTPHLPALWFDDAPKAAHYRREWARAVALRLEETYYRPISSWCEAHGVQLMGHPSQPDQIGLEGYFHVPGQDLVWRHVLPAEPSGLEGGESTQGKCTSSAMIHLGRRRNSNECFGAYGHELTWEEMKGLTDWCFVRGVNMLMPHAFYYSIRGARRNERPPDVGPHSPWWDSYKNYADYCQSLAWLNTDSQHVCQIAILGEPDHLPWPAAKLCFQSQRDFNYLENRHLLDGAEITASGISLAGMKYEAIILEESVNLTSEMVKNIKPLEQAGKVLRFLPAGATAKGLPWLDEAGLLHELDRLLPRDVDLAEPQPGLRVRHVAKAGSHYYLFTNESAKAFEFLPNLSAKGSYCLIDPYRKLESHWDGKTPLRLEVAEAIVVQVTKV